MTKEKLKNGTIIWTNEKGNVCRDDGPAIIYGKVCGRWVEIYNYEKQERAVTPNGVINNLSVIVSPNGVTNNLFVITNKCAWYIDGKEYIFEDWCHLKNKSKEEIVQYKLLYDINEWCMNNVNSHQLV